MRLRQFDNILPRYRLLHNIKEVLSYCKSFNEVKGLAYVFARESHMCLEKNPKQRLEYLKIFQSILSNYPVAQQEEIKDYVKQRVLEPENDKREEGLDYKWKNFLGM